MVKAAAVLYDRFMTQTEPTKSKEDVYEKDMEKAVNGKSNLGIFTEKDSHRLRAVRKGKGESASGS